MSRSLYRFLLTCVLLVVMPLQALAATTRLACGPNHHRTMVIADPAGAPASGAIHHHADGSTHEHRVERHADPASPETQQPGLETGELQTAISRMGLGSAFKCTACAPCCGSAALTSFVLLVVVAPVRVSDFPPFVDVQRSAHVGSLYRPPKAILA